MFARIDALTVQQAKCPSGSNVICGWLSGCFVVCAIVNQLKTFWTREHGSSFEFVNRNKTSPDAVDDAESPRKTLDRYPHNFHLFPQRRRSQIPELSGAHKVQSFPWNIKHSARSRGTYTFSVCSTTRRWLPEFKRVHLQCCFSQNHIFGALFCTVFVVQITVQSPTNTKYQQFWIAPARVL